MKIQYNTLRIRELQRKIQEAALLQKERKEQDFVSGEAAEYRFISQYRILSVISHRAECQREQKGSCEAVTLSD